MSAKTKGWAVVRTAPGGKEYIDPRTVRRTREAALGALACIDGTEAAAMLIKEQRARMARVTTEVVK